MIRDDSVLVKYTEIQNKIKKTLSTKFHNTLVYEKKYIKAKLREFNGVIKTNFLGDEVQKEGVHHTCIVCITIDSLMRMKQKLSTNLFRRMQL